MYKVIPPPPEEIPDEDIQLLTQQAAAKLIGVDPLRIRTAMNQWAKSHGKMGLAFVCIGARRKLRREAIRKWLDREEEMAMMGYI